eukprot:TRINITY_DN16919_c0_g1_i1.p1 TRINITY_DN16919_c0_g1~~TRINITY_DN16919_c0_g1_i1.p1  ORF type:complete len:135 (+),score=35.98 TRINITY_DN16919_c0_g1_i1:204-608(+)
MSAKVTSTSAAEAKRQAEAVVQRYFSAMQEQDFDTIMACLSEDVCVHFSESERDWSGRALVPSKFGGWFAAHPRLRIAHEIESIEGAEGGPDVRVAVRCVFTDEEDPSYCSKAVMRYGVELIQGTRCITSIHHT